MFAIGIEGGIAQFQAGRRALERNLVTLPLVRDDQLPPGMNRREGNHQSCDHAVKLLAVTVRKEEPSLLVDEQLVEMRLQSVLLQAQADACFVGDLSDKLFPLWIRQTKKGWIEFPNAAHGRIDERDRPFAIRRSRTLLDQGARLRFPKREADGTNTIDLQPRHRQR